MTVFVLIGLIGLVLLTVSLVFGEILDGVLDALSAEWLSGAVVGGFVSAFGFGAALADNAGMAQGGVIAIGVGAGALFAWFASWLTRVVRGGETAAIPGTDEVIGHAATVVSSIPTGGFGVVTVRIGGHMVRYNARADSPIEPGEEVHVTGVLSPTAVTVAPPWTSLDPS